MQHVSAIAKPTRRRSGRRRKQKPRKTEPKPVYDYRELSAGAAAEDRRDEVAEYMRKES